MSDINNGQNKPISSPTEVQEKLRKTKLYISILSIMIVVVVSAGFFFNRWKEANDVDYIDGNVMKIARTSTATTGSPWTGAAFVGQLTWAGLFQTDATFTEIIPELAESIDVTPDGLIYTIVLKNDLKWCDGTPLTLEDVVFSIESVVLCPSANNSFVNALYQIKGMEDWQEVGVESWENGGTHSLEGLSVSGNTLTVTLDNPYSSFPSALAQFVIYPKHALEHLDPSSLTDSGDVMAGFFSNPVSSGMYMVDCINEDGDLVLVHNPYYFGEHSDIEQVIMYGAYQSMYIDYYCTSGITDMVSYRNQAGFDEYFVNVLFYRYFVFNLMNGYENPTLVPKLDEDGKSVYDEDGEVVMVAEYGEDREENYPMQNYLLRQAISLAIDRESIAESVYLGNARYQFVRTGNAEYAEFLGDYNTSKAKSLLEESGYDVERPIIIKHYHSDANSRAMLAKVKESLDAIGLTVEVIQTTGGNVEMYEEAEYDILLKGYAAQKPSEWYVEYLSTANYVSNLLGTDEFDDLTLRLEGATNDTEYEKVWAEMQELDRTTMYRIPIVATTDCTYINANRIYVPEDIEFGNVRYRSDLRLDEWYVKKG